MTAIPAPDPRKGKTVVISEEVINCALEIIHQNRNLVNALDHAVEMDDYIYRAILKQAFEKVKSETAIALEENQLAVRVKAEKAMAVLSREELVTDPFYRAVLPLLVKVLVNEPILRLHADVASTIILDLADFKRQHRATSLTEVIVKNYGFAREAARS